MLGINRITDPQGKGEEDMTKLREEIRKFLTEEDAIGTVEMILILVVLIGLVVIFKNQLTTIVTDIFTRISTNAQTL